MRFARFHRTTRALFVLSACLLASACTTDAKGSAPQAPPGKDSATAGNAAQPGVGGAAGGRQAPSMTLASSDVAIIAPTTLEAGTALTGDLRPIETIDVRSRIEGEL